MSDEVCNKNGISVNCLILVIDVQLRNRHYSHATSQRCPYYSTAWQLCAGLHVIIIIFLNVNTFSKSRSKCPDGCPFSARFQGTKRVQRASFCITRWPESPKESGQPFHLPNSCGSSTRSRKTITWWEQKENSSHTALASQKLR